MSSKKQRSPQQKQSPVNEPAVTPKVTGPLPSTEHTTDTSFSSVSDTQQPLLKNLFFGSLLLMLFVTLVCGYNSGFHTDEMDMNNYCKANINYYLSGGTDTSYLGIAADDETKIETILRFYGSSFEYIPVIFNKITGLENSPAEFNVRHIFIQIFAILALLFTGLIARKAGGWRTSLFTIWLLYLTPAFFGGAFFNSKDIPFCTGYVASLYFIICFLEQLPKPSWKNTIWLTIAFAFTTGTRIGGLLLLGSLFLFLAVYALTNKQLMAGIMANLKGIVLQLGVVVAGGIALVVLAWPYVLKNPGENLTQTLTVVKKFPMKIPLNFEGVFTDSLSIPNYYLIRFITITVPVFILLAIVAGFVLLLLNFKKLNGKVYALILFTSIFPVAYAIYSNVALYSAWRHFLFIYPGLVILAGLALNSLFVKFQQPAIRIGILVAMVVGLAHPLSWMVKNHPYEYAYFNEISGGYKKIYYEYETDYWKITMKNGFEWLMKNEQIMQSRDSVVIGTDMDMFLKYYIKRHYKGAKIKVVLNDVGNRFAQPWRYAVFSKQFLAPDYLEKYFPPTETIYSENIDGMPETVVLKDVTRLDLLAKDAFIANNYPKSDSLLSLYLQKVPNNIGLFGIMALIKAYVGKNEESLDFGNRCLVTNPTELTRYNALVGMGVAYGNMRRFDSSLSKLNQAQLLNPNAGLAQNMMRMVMRLQEQSATTATAPK